MKKQVLLIALAAIFCIVPASAKLRFGLKAGLNVDKFSINNTKDILKADNQCGFTAGAMMECTVPVVGIGFDLSMMYTHMKGELATSSQTGSVGKNYLEIPLNLKYKLGLPVVSKIIKPMIFTGPNLALKLDKSTLQNLKTKTVQMGWNVGLGVELVNHLQVSAGYTIGINNVAKYIKPVDNALNLTDVKLKNNYWTITAAYLF